MDLSNGEIDFRSRVNLYRSYDAARQKELEELAEKFEMMKDRLHLLEADLADEKVTRQHWRKRAQDAESSVRRSQFILVLVDGDGYIFKDTYLRDANESGGARAAHDLVTEVQDYLRERNIIDPSGPDIQVMVNVYANRSVLAKYLLDADFIQSPYQLDQFFQSFTQSQALFQFIDCGYGKERADAKLRDTFRFFAYDVHCKHIFLACCHDNGYVAELDKYRHDPSAAPKTILVHSSQMGRGYTSLNFPIAQLNVFNTQPLPIVKREPVPAVMPPMNRLPSATILEEATPHTGGDTTSIPTPASAPAPAPAPASSTPSTWSTVTASNTTTTKKPAAPKTITAASTAQSPHSEPLTLATSNTHNKGIPVNRGGQRIDLKMSLPSSAELDAFESRIGVRKLCNNYHLGNQCYTYACRYDHDPIDTKLKNTLRYKARSIPCQNGPACRDNGCFYGHQCPWGWEKCANPKCAFALKGMHGIHDTEVSRYEPAEVH